MGGFMKIILNFCYIYFGYESFKIPTSRMLHIGRRWIFYIFGESDKPMVILNLSILIYSYNSWTLLIYSELEKRKTFNPSNISDCHEQQKLMGLCSMCQIDLSLMASCVGGGVWFGTKILALWTEELNFSSWLEGYFVTAYGKGSSSLSAWKFTEHTQRESNHLSKRCMLSA